MSSDLEPKFEILTDGDFAGTITMTPSAGSVPNLIGATVSVKVEDSRGAVHPLTTSVNGAGLVITYSATAAQTKTWSHGLASMDILATWPGNSPKVRTWRIYFTVYNPIPDA